MSRFNVWQHSHKCLLFDAPGGMPRCIDDELKQGNRKRVHWSRMFLGLGISSGGTWMGSIDEGSDWLIATRRPGLRRECTTTPIDDTVRHANTITSTHSFFDDILQFGMVYSFPRGMLDGELNQGSRKGLLKPKVFGIIPRWDGIDSRNTLAG